jgi:hypothetical protein
MVQIKSPGGKAKEEVQDDIGGALRDGLAYDDPNNLIDVATGQNVDIDGTGNVRVQDSNIHEQALVIDLVGGL